MRCVRIGYVRYSFYRLVMGQVVDGLGAGRVWYRLIPCRGMSCLRKKLGYRLMTSERNLGIRTGGQSEQ